MSMIHDSVNVSNPTAPSSACDQATSSTTPPSTSDQTPPPSVSDQTTTSTTPPSASDQTPPPSVSDQTTNSTTPPSVSDQTPPPCVSDQNTDHFVQTSVISRVQHVESYEMREHLQIVSANEHAGYLHAIDDDAHYLQIIDDNLYTVSNKPRYNEADNAESISELEVQPQGYYSLIYDDTTYQEIADDETSNPQVDDHGSYDELNEAQTTSKNKESFNTAADFNAPLQNWTCVTIIVISMFVGVALLVTVVTVGLIYSCTPYNSVNSATNVSSMHRVSAVIDAFGIKRTPSLSPIQYQQALSFNDVIRNVSSSNLNAPFSTFSVPASNLQNSLYWMHVGIEVPPNASSNFQVGSTPFPLIKHFIKKNPSTILSKSLVVQLAPNTSVSINSNVNGSVTVTTAYWSSFQLNNLMYPLLTVSAEARWGTAHNEAIKKMHWATQQMMKVKFNTVNINEGKAWNKRNSYFTAPHSGIYMFTIIMFVRLNLSSDNSYKLTADLPDTPRTLYTGLSLQVTKTDSTIPYRHPVIQVSMSNQPRSPSLTTVSASCLVSLSQTDTVEVWLRKNYNWLTGIVFMRTSVSAFYYSPVSNVQVVWSATVPFSDKAIDLTVESSLQYNKVKINLGAVWSPTHNAATITVPGIYYTVVTMGIICDQPTAFWLRVNKENAFKVIPSLLVRQTQENGAVIRLDVGDTLTEFDCCCLTLQPCRNPVLTPDGYLYDKEAILEYIVHQKREIARKLKEYEKQKQNQEKEAQLKLKNEQDAKLKKFIEKQSVKVTSTSDQAGSSGISNMHSGQDKQLPSFWIPSLTPSAKEEKLQKPDETVRCPMSGKPLKLKDLIDIKFTPIKDGDKRSLITKDARYVCAVTNDVLGNSVPCAALKTSGNVVTMECVEKLIKKDMIDPTNGAPLTDKDILVLQRGASGFAAMGGDLVAKKQAPSIIS